MSGQIARHFMAKINDFSTFYGDYVVQVHGILGIRASPFFLPTTERHDPMEQKRRFLVRITRLKIAGDRRVPFLKRQHKSNRYPTNKVKRSNALQTSA